MRLLAALSTVGVVVALGAMPYGYYMLLRLLLCVTTSLVAAYASQGSGWRLAGVALALLYNPFFPVHLSDKSLWTIVNLATLVVIWVSALRLRWEVWRLRTRRLAVRVLSDNH